MSSFEKFPIISPTEKPTESSKEEPKADPEKPESTEAGAGKIITPAVEGRKLTPEEIEKRKRIIEESDKATQIRKKLERGELISQEEAAFLRAEETLKKRKEKELEGEKSSEVSEVSEVLETKEKSKEEILSEKREAFARSEIENAEILKTIKKLKAEKEAEDIKPEDLEIITKCKGKKKEELLPEEKEALERKERFVRYLEKMRLYGVNEVSLERAEEIYDKLVEHKKTKQEYTNALTERRSELYKSVFKEIEKMGIPKEEAEKLIKQKMAEILKTTVVQEANALYDVKNKIKLESKADNSFLEKAWKLAGRTEEWYRKLSRKQKLTIAAGLFAGGLAAGAIGGTVGMVLGVGVFSAKQARRILSGAGTAVTVEAFMQRYQEKKAEKKTIEYFGENLSERIKNNDGSLNEKMFELTGKKRNEKVIRYILAGTAGTIVGTGLFGKAISKSIGWVGRETGATKYVGKGISWLGRETGIGNFVKEHAERIGIIKPESHLTTTGALEHNEAFTQQPEANIAEPGANIAESGANIAESAAIETSQVAQKGDSVWKIIGRQLEQRYGEKFCSMDEARRIYIIDALKDRVAADPESFGLTDVDKIKIGRIYDFLPKNPQEIEEAFRQASALKEAQINNILAINEWTANHPGQEVTPAKIDEILEQRKGPEYVPRESVGVSRGVMESSSGKGVDNVFKKEVGAMQHSYQKEATGIERSFTEGVKGMEQDHVKATGAMEQGFRGDVKGMEEDFNKGVEGMEHDFNKDVKEMKHDFNELKPKRGEGDLWQKESRFVEESRRKIHGLKVPKVGVPQEDDFSSRADKAFAEMDDNMEKETEGPGGAAMHEHDVETADSQGNVHVEKLRLGDKGSFYVEGEKKLGELVYINVLGFSNEEYGSIKNLTLGEFLKKFDVDTNKAWENWKNDPSFKKEDIPSFNKKIALADAIRSLMPGKWAEKMTLQQFLEKFGTKKH